MSEFLNILKSLFNLISAKGYGPLFSVLLCVSALILFFRILCWIFGILSLPYLGRKKNVRTGINAYLPCGQLRCTLMLGGKERMARQSVHLIWWFFTAAFVMVTALVWFYRGLRLQYLESFKVIMIIIAILAFAIMVAIYVMLRKAELTVLRKMLSDKKEIILSICGMCVGVPLQRFFIYKHRHRISKQ